MDENDEEKQGKSDFNNCKRRTHQHTSAHECTRTHTRTHARTHALTHARTHTRTHERTHPTTHPYTHALEAFKTAAIESKTYFLVSTRSYAFGNKPLFGSSDPRMLLRRVVSDVHEEHPTEECDDSCKQGDRNCRSLRQV